MTEETIAWSIRGRKQYIPAYHLTFCINMASKKAGKMAKGAKKAAGPKIQHPPFLKAYIPAGQASPAPPLGPQLGGVSMSATSSGYLW